MPTCALASPVPALAEVVDRASGAIGTFRRPCAFDTIGADLAMSDLLPANRIESRTDFPNGREDLLIHPNPLRTYHRSESVFIYLELYNLARDRFGRTQYEIAYRIGRPKDKEIDPALFWDLDLPEGTLEIRQVSRTNRGEDGMGVSTEDAFDYEVTYRVPRRNLIGEWMKKNTRSWFRKIAETTITARYEGDREEDFTYLQIDVAQVPAGIHKLTVTVKDDRTGKTCERNMLFRVVE